MSRFRLLLPLPVVALTAAACLGGGGGGVAPDDIHFDTFDGGSIPLSEITEEQMIALRDVIPPLDAPKYDDVSGGDWLDDDDLVLGYESASGEAWAYPLKILNFHEIVNDTLDGIPVLITYCPLCRSGIVYDRRLEGTLLSFGNSSALYESDLVMFDRETDSFWWQVAGEAIVGTLTGKRLTTLPAVTATWGEWKALHPDTRVLSRDTGFDRPYERDPFSDYAELVNSGRFRFPVSERGDDRLSPADEVLGVVIDGSSIAYPLRRLGDAAVNDVVAGEQVVVFSSSDGPSGSVFRSQATGRDLTFRFDGSGYFDEQTGSEWDLSGRAVAGPLKGERLEPLPSRYTFWFAYLAAFPDTELFIP